MCDTIECLAADILASDVEDGQNLADRLRVLSRASDVEYESLQIELNKARTLIRNKTAEIRKLKGENAKLKKMLFGATSDRNPEKEKSAKDKHLNNNSIQDNGLCDRASDTGNSSSRKKMQTNPSVPRNRNGRGRRVFPKHLERRTIYMGTSDKKCPCGCGGSILDYDNNETLEVVPARYYVAVCQYPRYRCRAKGVVVGTRFTPRIFPQSTMSNGILANAIFMRFGTQLPWYRQETIFKSYGIHLNRSTLMKWSNRVATQALLPIYELLKAEAQHNSARLFMDETTVPMLSPGKGTTKASYLFAIHRDDQSFGGNTPPFVLYCPSKTRAMYKIHELLCGVRAIVQTDAYAGYGQLGRKGTVVEGIISPKCWAHTRRNFTDNFEFNGTSDAKAVIGLISELYAEEAKIRGKPPLVRATHRRKFSAPILARLKAFLEVSARFLPQRLFLDTFDDVRLVDEVVQEAVPCFSGHARGGEHVA